METQQQSDHADILAAIAHAADVCTREPQPIAQPAHQPQQAPLSEGQAGLTTPAAAPNHPPHPQQAATAQAVALPTSPPPLEARKGPSDAEMQEVMKERDRKKFKLGMAVNLTILALLLAPFLGFSVWYQSSEENQQAFASLMGNVREVPNDVKGMANIKESYDEALAEVGAHGSAIDDAARALGVDPNEFNESTDPKDDDTFMSEQAQQQSMN